MDAATNNKAQLACRGRFHDDLWIDGLQGWVMNPTGLRQMNVLVMHAEPLLAIGVFTALSGQPDLAVRRVGRHEEASSSLSSDVVVADYTSAMKLTEERSASPRYIARQGARILVLTANNRERDVRVALERGILGYLLPDCSPEDLANGVRAVGRGSRCICLSVAARMADSLSQERLTSREQEVLALMTQGRCNKSIANELGLALGTIKVHVQAILAKLRVASRTEAVALAMQRGMTEFGVVY